MLDLAGKRTGERIQILRERKGLSRPVLAGLVGMSASWLKGIEQGRRLPPRLPVLAGCSGPSRADRPSRSVPLQAKKRRKTLIVCAPCHRDVLRKLDCHDRAELAALAHEIQLIK